MVDRNMTGNVRMTRLMTAQAAGSTDFNGDVLDTEGFDLHTFALELGALTATAVTGLKIQQGDLANGSDMADLEGSLASIADDQDDGILAVDVYRPIKRYLRPVATRATANAVIDGCVAYQSGPPRVLPVAQSSTVADSVIVISPEEGTP